MSDPAEAKTNSEDAELFGRFVDAYNKIDQHLRKELKMKGHHTGFVSVVIRYARKKRYFPEEDELKLFAEMRNLLVHRAAPHDPLFVPSIETVRRIEEIRDRLLEPRTVGREFGKQIVTVSGTDSLSSVLLLMRSRDLARFPVYHGDLFQGLLTHHGITRWLASRVTTDPSSIDFGQECVQSVLEHESTRKSYIFVARDEPLDTVVAEFLEEPQLEAAIITEHGDRNEKPLGIATTYDISRLQPRIRPEAA